jgi:hypothetical protein
MTDDKEIEQRRIAERRAYRLTLTDDASRLMEALKLQHPEAWQSYRETVDAEGNVEGESWTKIVRLAFELFPGRTTQDISDLLSRMLHMVRDELGKEKWE